MLEFFKNITILILHKLIELIEKYEYRNLNLDENDISKKILNSLPLGNIKALSDTGFEEATYIHITQPYTTYKLITKNHQLECADNHIVFDENFNEIFVKDLNLNTKIQTESGIEEVISVKKMRFKSSMFDLSINHINHRYYTNGILSHNTISSAIMMLHFVLFNNNKNVLVTANKLDTAVEVLDKIGEIYQRLPFFLQQGILNWNQKFRVFENKSRIKGFATTKTASIGQSADFLYLDEFAYLPDNIADKFYKSVFPTIANIENSKIIITSTPNGFNLFHKLLVEAEKPEGEKSSYVAKRVYWWQVPKRFVTYVRLNTKKLQDVELEPEVVLEHFKKRFPNNNSELYYNDELKKWVINVYNSTDCSEDDVTREIVNDIRIPEIAEITTWKKETIKDIGGEEAFNQEFDLRFINSSRSLLDEALLDEINKNKKPYEWKSIQEFDTKLKFSYLDLKWTTDDEKYKPEARKDYKIVLSVDVAEGLGLDYSVINIFKMIPKPTHIIESQKANYKNIVDFIRLEQIGIYRCNLVSVAQLAELLYLLVFEHFNQDNVKIVLEVNTYGNELLAHLPNVFEGNNEYGSSVFYRFKHRSDALEEKIGLKVGDNKNLMVKDYQDKLQDRSIVVSEHETIQEMTTFIKHTTSAGNVRYAADGSAHDDAVMTIVNMTSVFGKNDFKGLVEEFLEDYPDTQLKTLIDNILNNIQSNSDGPDYKQLLEIRRRKMSNNKRNQEARKGWGLDSDNSYESKRY
jgi:hypothetical protein